MINNSSCYGRMRSVSYNERRTMLMKRRRNRGLNGIVGFFKNLAYCHERYKLECEYDDCSPLREYFRDHPDEEKDYYKSYKAELAKLNKKYGKN